MSVEIDDVAESVRGSLHQLHGWAPPEPALDEIVSGAVEANDADPDAAVSRLAKRATDLIESTEPDRPARARGPDGRFAKAALAEPKAAADEQPKAATESDLDRITGKIDEVIDRGKPNLERPPQAMNGQLKAKWNELPEDIRAEFIRLEEASRRGFQSYRDRVGDKDLEALLAPRRETWRKLGHASDSAAIGHLFNLSDNFQVRPVETALHIFSHMHPDAQNAVRQQLGLQSAAPQITEQQVQEWAGMQRAQEEVAKFDAATPTARDPQVRELMRQAMLGGHAGEDLGRAHDIAVVHLANQYQQSGQAIPAHINEAAGLAMARHEIAQFEADTANYPLFPVLKATMQSLLMNGKAGDLPSAYQQAMRADPVIGKMLAGHELEKKRRAANASLTGAPHGATERRRTAKPGTFQDAVDDVREAINQLR